MPLNISFQDVLVVPETEGLGSVKVFSIRDAKTVHAYYKCSQDFDGFIFIDVENVYTYKV